MRKQFIKKANNIIKLIKKSKYNLEDVLKDLGFKSRKPLCYSNCHIIYYNKKIGIVFKPEPNIVADEYAKKPTNKFIVPTIYFANNLQERWCAQPLCDRKNSDKASRFFRKQFPAWQDNDPMNCGYWNNQPMIFDW